jgi:hypothetical protein
MNTHTHTHTHTDVRAHTHANELCKEVGALGPSRARPVIWCVCACVEWFYTTPAGLAPAKRVKGEEVKITKATARWRCTSSAWVLRAAVGGRGGG